MIAELHSLFFEATYPLWNATPLAPVSAFSLLPHPPRVRIKMVPKIKRLNLRMVHLKQCGKNYYSGFRPGIVERPLQVQFLPGFLLLGELKIKAEVNLIKFFLRDLIASERFLVTFTLLVVFAWGLPKGEIQCRYLPYWNLNRR